MLLKSTPFFFIPPLFNIIILHVSSQRPFVLHFFFARIHGFCCCKLDFVLEIKMQQIKNKSQTMLLSNNDDRPLKRHEIIVGTQIVCQIPLELTPELIYTWHELNNFDQKKSNQPFSWGSAQKIFLFSFFFVSKLQKLQRTVYSSKKDQSILQNHSETISLSVPKIKTRNVSKLWEINCCHLSTVWPNPFISWHNAISIKLNCKQKTDLHDCNLNVWEMRCEAKTFLSIRPIFNTSGFVSLSLFLFPFSHSHIIIICNFIFDVTNNNNKPLLVTGW